MGAGCRCGVRRQPSSRHGPWSHLGAKSPWLCCLPPQLWELNSRQLGGKDYAGSVCKTRFPARSKLSSLMLFVVSHHRVQGRMHHIVPPSSDSVNSSWHRLLATITSSAHTSAHMPVHTPVRTCMHISAHMSIHARQHTMDEQEQDRQCAACGDYACMHSIFVSAPADGHVIDGLANTR